MKIDQFAASNAFPSEEFKGLSQEKWNAKKDSIYRANQKRVAKIFENIGYPDYDIVGTKGSAYFWAVVQHSDFNPQFQKLVLDSMLLDVQKRNADNRLYALLTDRGLEPIEEYLADMTKTNLAMSPTAFGLSILAFALIIAALVIMLILFRIIRKRTKKV